MPSSPVLSPGDSPSALQLRPSTSSPPLSPGDSPSALQLRPPASLPDDSPSTLQLPPPASPPAAPARDWHADPAVRAVRADWHAMSVVHFILVFHAAIDVPEVALLDCLPERAIAFACRASPSARKPSDVDGVVAVGNGDGDGDGGRDENEGEDEDDNKVDEGGGDGWAGKDMDLERVYASGDAEAAPLFDALVRFLSGEGARSRDVARLRARLLRADRFEARVVLLKELVDGAAEFPAVRRIVIGQEEGKRGGGSGGDGGGRRQNGARVRSRGAGGDGVAPGVRVAYGGRDGNGARFVWVRGLEGCCSGRVERVCEKKRGGGGASGGKMGPGLVEGEEGSGVVLEGALVRELAEKLEMTPGALRAERVCGAWLREKWKKASAREAKKRAEMEEEREREERREKRRRREIGDGEIRVDGVLVTGEHFGRGRRARAPVRYVEVDDIHDDDHHDHDNSVNDTDGGEDEDEGEASVSCADGDEWVGDGEEDDVDDADDDASDGADDDVDDDAGGGAADDADDDGNEQDGGAVICKVETAVEATAEDAKEKCQAEHLQGQAREPVKLGARRYRALATTANPISGRERAKVRQTEKPVPDVQHIGVGRDCDTSDGEFLTDIA